MNILQAITNIINLSDINIIDNLTGNNRANNTGEALELFIKEAFSNTFNTDSDAEKLKRFSEVFSYQGTKNHPPDLMIKDGDAIEIKKLESVGGEIQLNSSFPKSYLHKDDKKILSACIAAENWEIKDFLYIMGHVAKSKLKSIWFIYGDCYAASRDVYEPVMNCITETLSSGYSMNESDELGRVNDVDPLKITKLRVRGMWLITHPKKVFSYLDQIMNLPKESNFEIVSLMQASKYTSFPISDRIQLESIKGISVNDVNIKNPNNPVQLMNCKMITYTR